MKRTDFKTAVFILIIIFFVLQLLVYLGIGTQQSPLHFQIGYREISNSQSWSANYIFLYGSKQRTIRPTTQPATLHITVQTDAGECSLQIKNADGEAVFEKENIQTSSFYVNVSGEVVVRIIANKHQGGFSVTQIS